MTTQNPVLMLVFNRPHLTQQVFDRVRLARPPRLYVAADGPRPGNPNDLELTRQTRAIFDQIDWPCELHTRFLENNQGCRLGVSSGITWFFEQEEQGIVLEDDVLPIPEFFTYCDEMLARYVDQKNVFSVCGCNLVRPWYEMKTSVEFSRFMCVWGWASWRRAWQFYDEKIADWPTQKKSPGSPYLKFSGLNKLFWRLVFDLVYDKKIGTWDHQWVYAHWKNQALTVIPKESLVTNLGFGKDATHTSSQPPDYVLRMQPKAFELGTPNALPLVQESQVLTRTIAVNAIRINWKTYLKLWVRKVDWIFKMAKHIQNRLTA